MKQKIQEKIQIPEGITCEFQNNILKCKKDSLESERELKIPATQIKIENSDVLIECEKGNKNHYKIIKTNVAHVNNLLKGLQEPFEYKLEAASVHFTMTLKVEGDKLAITNFLGEKIPRHAQILPNVDISINGQVVTLSSPDKEAAGQTAGNIEKATKLKGRDKRVFQDGVYLVSKAGKEV